MNPSSANVVAYDLRPAKQAERRMLLDFLKCASETGIGISDCRYVGMAGNKFYDFHLLYRYLGVRKMISLERDTAAHARSRFNCPYDFIKVEQTTAAEFLAADTDQSPTIYWLDYDDGLTGDIVADITSLGSKMVLRGFAFITINAEPRGILINQSSEQRLEHFQETLGDFSIELTATDMENSQFSSTVHGILLAAFRNAFAARKDGEFQPLFQVQYRDTSIMTTIGGCFCAPRQSRRIQERMDVNLPFLLKAEPYRIRNLNLTERERVLFDLAVTRHRSNSRSANSLRSLGFGQEDFVAYRDLIRFLPRYYESII
jgi:hypothetical protein